MRMQRVSSFRTKTDALSLATRVWEALDTARSLSLWIAAKYGDHNCIVSLKDVNPLNYVCPLEFAKDYQACKFLSKSVELRTGIDKRSVALQKFKEAEASCLSTNAFFRNVFSGTLSMVPRVERIYSSARAIAADILGRCPSLEELDFAFGPGASFGVRGDTSVYKKVTSDLECTYAMAPYLQDLLSEVPGWVESDLVDVQLVRGSELTFVPKDASTDRAICIEPLLNGFMQKGIGSWIRRRLSRFGVDLDDQGINQGLAQRAFGHSLSTIDLSSASDTIAYNLVLDFLPPDWFSLLDACRCPSFLIDGTWFTFQKFSSMGNAYTFELETLIFYSLACAVCKELGISYSSRSNLHVYGDDIIVPRAAFDLLTEVIHVCGFSVNKAKSFKDGPFFESCGADFFMGIPVRPIFLKERIDRRLLRYYYATNSLRRIQARLESVSDALTRRGAPVNYRDTFRALGDIHSWMVAKLPLPLRVYGPEGNGDGHLISEFDEALPRFHPSWEGWEYRSFSERPIRVKLGDVPAGYALYFCREPVTVGIRERRGANPYRSDFFPLSRASDHDPDHGSGYDLRGRVKVNVVRSFCASSWRGWRTTFHYEGTTTRHQAAEWVS